MAGRTVVMTVSDAAPRMPIRTRIAMAISMFANRRGLYFGRRSTRIHAALYRRSRGRIGGHFPGWPAAPMLLLNHVGAKSGIRRTSPLIYLREDDAVVVVASKAGQPTNPAWLHNLIANPETTVELGAEVRRVRARVASEDEREALWPKLAAFYPGFEDFQRMAMAQGRTIPLVMLEPR
jgi:deazaflavin-dependent oxidoreductase (nitroreductase family)